MEKEQYNTTVTAGDILVLISPKGKKHIRKVDEKVQIHTADGTFTWEMLTGKEFGNIIFAPKDVPYMLQKASLYDILFALKRKTQIIYPKDIAYICLRLGVGKDTRIIEAGSGSGGLTTALSYITSGKGHVYTYEAREEFYTLTKENLAWAKLGENVTQHHQDIAEGFVEHAVDALFLDVREPWLYLDNVIQALKPSGTCAFLLPTVNQVTTLLEALESRDFSDIEVEEVLLRKWKAVPDRFRPFDRMVAHTSFLLFARHQKGVKEWEKAQSKGTREYKQYMAKESRRKIAQGNVEENIDFSNTDFDDI